jgi:hypothetical protein
MLGELLSRESTRLDPQALGKIRRTVAAGLEDRDPAVRASAAGVSLVFRDEADIREKLESLAAFDPYFDLKGIAGSQDFPEYPVRAAAARVLTATEEKLYYVSRTAEERACRVQSGAEPAAGARFLGPFYNPTEATQQMCRHKDGWKDSPVKCWTTYPKTNCGWPGNENPAPDSNHKVTKAQRN